MNGRCRTRGELIWYASSITVSIFYFFVAACIAELASAMPSSAGGMPILRVPVCLADMADLLCIDSLSLGFRDGWSKIRTYLWLLCWMVEFLCVSIRYQATRLR